MCAGIPPDRLKWSASTTTDVFARFAFATI